jgi:UDP-N-acetyl-D-mannosaminuronate dehydrogenase
VNDGQPGYVIKLIMDALKVSSLKALKDRRIGLLGLSYKPNVDDLRESPAVAIALELARLGAVVYAYEPYKTAAELPGVQVALSLDEAVENVDLIVLQVGHSELSSIEPQVLREISNCRIVLDLVDGWEYGEWQAQGFRFIRLGDATRKLSS